MRQFDPRIPLQNPYSDYEPDLLPDDEWDVDRSSIEALDDGKPLTKRLAQIKPRKPRPLKYGRGRPFQAAYIPPGTELTEIVYRKAFASVMRQVNYKEITAIAYALNRHRGTVQKWKYGLHRPCFSLMFWVVDWFKAGRNTYTVHHREAPTRRPI